MSSLRAEHGGAIGILLILYALQTYIGIERVRGKEVVLWIDNAEVLARGRDGTEATEKRDPLVLDYDLMQVMAHLQDKIVMRIRWEKVDSHIATRVYKPGVKPKGDKFSIRLNQQVDVWAGNERERMEVILGNKESPQFLYKESKIMVEMNDGLIYGDIGKILKEDLSKCKMEQYLMGKNKNWDRAIFTSIDWDAIEGCLNRMPDEQVTHIIKLAHGWQHDGYQRGYFTKIWKR